VEAIGLSAEDGSDGRTFLNHELAGTVISVGENVTGIEPGSKVIGFAVDNLSTYQVTPSNLVRPLTTSTSIVEAATIPSAFSAVIYGLEELAKVEEGETVAIVDGMGAVGLAALQWCKLLGVEVVVIATSDSTEALLLEQDMVPKERIVSAVGGGLSARLKAATGGKGIDVLLCSATSDEAMITECGRNLAHSARVVSCGATDEQSEALAGLPVIKMRLSVFHFDLVDLIRHRPRVVAR
jgi:NADPH:quinone reductase-like Zn-dependent oxidoreductase